MLNKTGNVQNFLGCDASYDDAQIVIFGAPYDATTSNRPGTRFAPATMRQESYGLETYSPYLDKDLEDDVKVYDAGDLELYGGAEGVLNTIEQTTAEIAADGKTPLMLGGEHLVTLGAVRALAKKHPNLHIIHFDAHTDLRDEYLGEKLSHATVMRRCHDILGDGRIFQYGIRSGTKEEFYWARQHIANGVQPKMVAELSALNAPFYFTLDLDVLDPSIFAGTGTPEAGGISFEELRHNLTFLRDLNIVGCDIVELAPNYDPSGVSTATACKVLREILLTIKI
ncbi:MAG: agmatinase [Defluviitaleaceae bacterium]|nr:agmatinase [Defluviitaleaceae bacterium]